MNLFSLLDSAARRFADRGAVYRGEVQVQTYRELHRRSLQLAASLAPFGTGARVGIATENCPQYLEILFGVWAAGCVVVPINYKLHPREMLQVVEDAGMSLVLASEPLAVDMAAQMGEGKCRTQVTSIGSLAYDAMFSEPIAVAAPTVPDTLAWLFYTSGTTGRSKGAMLTHRNLMAMTVGHLADVERIDEHASQIHAAPMSHGSGLYIPAYIARGARQVVPASGGFDPAEFLDLCDVHPGCGAFLAPTMVQRLRLQAEQSGRRPRNLRSVVYGGGPMYVEEMKKSLQVFGRIFTQIYGQGETPMTITSLRREDHALGDHVLGSVGQVRTGVQLAVVDGDGKALPPGKMGEIVCRSDVVMAGYWQNPSATAEALRDGWLYTGDVGSLDESGYLTLRDRSKDVIISGGSNIYPREVEEALLSHPEVSEVCVVGQTDEEWGEVVVAFIVPTPGAKLTVVALDGHCLQRIARFKRPKHYRFTESLPKNSYGKVLKRELRTQLQ
ncbi:MAG: AMP-binding protein [Pseudorhodoferax sp.]